MEMRLAEYNVKYASDHMPLTNQRQLFSQDPAGNGVELNFSTSHGNHAQN